MYGNTGSASLHPFSPLRTSLKRARRERAYLCLSPPQRIPPLGLLRADPRLFLLLALLHPLELHAQVRIVERVVVRRVHRELRHRPGIFGFAFASCRRFGFLSGRFAGRFGSFTLPVKVDHKVSEGGHERECLDAERGAEMTREREDSLLVLLLLLLAPIPTPAPTPTPLPIAPLPSPLTSVIIPLPFPLPLSISSSTIISISLASAAFPLLALPVSSLSLGRARAFSFTTG
jgi:hypothetical protein